MLHLKLCVISLHSTLISCLEFISAPKIKVSERVRELFQQTCMEEQPRYKHKQSSVPPSRCLPKKVVFAVQSPLPRKTLLCQITFALAALHALDVPGSVQHVQQKAVQDRPLTAGAVDHGSAGQQPPPMNE